jgi:hypothetical protein
MALVSLNLKPSEKQLREFGEITLCMCNVIGLLLFWLGGLPTAGLIIFCLCGLAVFALSRLSVRLVKPIYLGLIVLTFPIGWAVSHIFMAFFYFVIIGLVGLIFKILKRDPLHRRYDPQAESYWIPYRHNRTARDYFHQF